VVIRITIQFLAQIVGLLILRRTRPEFPRPFKMWLYPLPALIAIGGFLFVLFSRPNYQKELRYAAVLIVVGSVVYLVRAYMKNEYPFSPAPEATA
jgi:amino acid transporter